MKSTKSSKPLPRSEAELRMKLGSTSVKGLSVDLGDSFHLRKSKREYVSMIETDTIHFDKGFRRLNFIALMI
ncbi:DUF3898 domain-containing protein [Peribacillus frigoritolerans]|uniref:DUF3898 domain-containing protein n=1 Tax=Peribacillus frigoritolerans TaxID=450367 RepID=UPI002E1FEBEF|nr:DUF3898 domain-containing protein [Peribacillus frigoritolerans]